jgi:hypothetical protein
MGIGPADLNSGDQICALFGGRTHYIVRPIEGSLDEYQFVGGCYIKKWMSGEAVDLVGEGVLTASGLGFVDYGICLALLGLTLSLFVLRRTLVKSHETTRVKSPAATSSASVDPL